MLISMRRLIYISIFGLVISCGQSDNNLLSSKYLVGLNDSAQYLVDRDGRTTMIVKEKYLEKGEYTMMLHRDTIELGEEFSAILSIDKEGYGLYIQEPTVDTLTKEGYDQYKKENPEATYVYRFKPTKKGLQEFRGEVRHDSITEPFIWRFLVK
jgi:hypothetical protein